MPGVTADVALACKRDQPPSSSDERLPLPFACCPANSTICKEIKGRPVVRPRNTNRHCAGAFCPLPTPKPWMSLPLAKVDMYKGDQWPRDGPTSRSGRQTPPAAVNSLSWESPQELGSGVRCLACLHRLPRLLSLP